MLGTTTWLQKSWCSLSVYIRQTAQSVQLFSMRGSSSMTDRELMSETHMLHNSMHEHGII